MNKKEFEILKKLLEEAMNKVKDTKSKAEYAEKLRQLKKDHANS